MFRDFARLLMTTGTTHVFKWAFEILAHIIVFLAILYFCKKLLYTVYEVVDKVRKR